MIETTYLAGDQSVRPLITRLVGPFFYNPGISFATIPSASISNAVAELCSLWFAANTDAINHGLAPAFHYYNDVRCTTSTLQPAVFAVCKSNDVTASYDNLLFWSPLGDRLSMSPVGAQIPTSDNSQSNRSYASLNWVSLSNQSSDKQHLGAILTVPGTDSDGGLLLSCVVDARWVNASTDVTFSRGPLIITGDMQSRILEGLFDKGHGIEQFAYIPITPNWAKSIDRTAIDSNTTVFDKLCNASGLCSASTSIAAQEPVHAAEAILSVMLANALALVRSNATIQGTLKGNGTDYEWQKALLRSGDIFDVPQQAKGTYAPLKFSVTVNGYGYGLAVSNILSIVILLIYSVVAISYVVYLVAWEPVVSTSWDSISEILALALKSEKSTELPNTGAGIRTAGALETPMRIIASNGEIELRTGKRAEGVKEDTLQPNKYYS